MKIYLLIFFLFMIYSCKVSKIDRTHNFPKIETEVQNIPNRNKVWVFILAGQSNMAGRAFISPKDTLDNSRIFSLTNKGKIVYAKEPLHFYDPNKTGLDCGLSFAKYLIRKIPPDVSILLVPTAVGGSAISQWIGDSLHRNVNLLSNFKDKVSLAKNFGTIKAILWHQGETDANNNEADKYTKRLSMLCNIFRQIVGDYDLPILLGELGSYSKFPDNWKKINNALLAYHFLDANTSIIPTNDLKHMGDFEHFNSKSVRKLGKRYAKAFLLNIK